MFERKKKIQKIQAKEIEWSDFEIDFLIRKINWREDLEGYVTFGMQFTNCVLDFLIIVYIVKCVLDFDVFLMLYQVSTVSGFRS